MGGWACPRPEDWALVDRCVGQFDDEASHVDIRYPSAEVELTEAMMTAEPTTYAPSR
jgi:hypothetical protein